MAPSANLSKIFNAMLSFADVDGHEINISESLVFNDCRCISWMRTCGFEHFIEESLYMDFFF